ncbi:hypothetical protein [Flavicella sp.]|uniref:hypothetical protein n=1 Tax=Flavicella sp. TaxID=2957742 RepID=UPI00262B2941|nr:hypothetical protein [Flavicella sp.]MDG1805416.1 hypothetical protein [Flavicella sp.]
MTKKTSTHSFHIPVMGLAFTVDSPIKIAKYGISSVVSIVDDILIENMNSFYSEKYSLPFKKYSTKDPEARSNRITSYLNNMDMIVKQKFHDFKLSLTEKKEALDNYLELLPDISEVKKSLLQMVENNTPKEVIQKWIQENLVPGNIDVNIMTKLDNGRMHKNEALPSHYNDAHTALKGFAESTLKSSIVLSAGMNPRLYSYFEQFEDFYPNEQEQLNKKIILKVSDYRSATIQGMFFAKKGLWVSEYRIESGLNCGGHAFATEGLLLGPILDTFTENKQSLIENTFETYKAALEAKGKHVPSQPLDIEITVQGGVGTAKEHQFLLDNYDVNSVGWGSPFLLVPEATTVDPDTLNVLSKAKEEDLYLSNISPLGVPFNSVKGVSNDAYKLSKLENDNIGSPCPKKFLALNRDENGKSICTASQKFQNAEIEKLKSEDLSTAQYKDKFKKITEKSCLCIGLANAGLIEHDIDSKDKKAGVLVCPGPNIAYFDKKVSLKNMVQHIYGQAANLTPISRPNMFVKELEMYVQYFNEKIEQFKISPDKKQEKYLNKFSTNLNEGILYYKSIFKDAEFISSFSTLEGKLQTF